VAKKKARVKRPAVRQKTAQLPEGFQPIGSYAPSWNYAEEPLLQGVILEFSETIQTRQEGKKTKKVKVKTATIQRKNGSIVKVWESTTMRPLWENFEEGDAVAIAYQGLGQKKKGMNPAKLFAIGRAVGAVKAKPKARSKTKPKARTRRPH